MGRFWSRLKQDQFYENPGQEVEWQDALEIFDNGQVLPGYGNPGARPDPKDDWRRACSLASLSVTSAGGSSGFKLVHIGTQAAPRQMPWNYKNAMAAAQREIESGAFESKKAPAWGQ